MTEEKTQEPADLFKSLWEKRGTGPDSETPAPASTSETPEEEGSESPAQPTLMEQFEQLETEGEEGTAEEGTDKTAAAPDLDIPADSGNKSDIEEVLVKGANGRRQKIKIDYSDRTSIKKAHLLASGMRKFQAERDATKKLVEPIETAYGKPITEIAEEVVSLKKDFDKIENVFQESGAKGLVELLGGADAWNEAVDNELSQRDYISNLTADEKYQLELKKRDEHYNKQILAERKQREEFQKQMEEKEEVSTRQQLESKLHPAFDRYRFAGKLGDPATENLYDEAIWSKVKQRLGEYPDALELNQAVIDKEFRTVASMFKKHIKAQAEKQVKKTVEKKKSDTMQRAQVTASKGLSGSSQQKKILQGLKQGNLKNAFAAFYQNK